MEFHFLTSLPPTCGMRWGKGLGLDYVPDPFTVLYVTSLYVLVLENLFSWSVVIFRIVCMT